MAHFLRIVKDLPPKESGQTGLLIVTDDQGREVLIFGTESQAKVRKGITDEGDVTVEGEVGSYTKDGQTRFKWSLPSEQQQRRGGGRPSRDPIVELVGIAHHQAMSIVFDHRPPEDPDSLSKFWEKARGHILAMAREIAEDRQALVKELKANA